MKRTPIAIALVAFAAAAFAAAPGMYKWVDEKGRVQYSDQPPPPGTKILEERKLTKSGVPTQELPYSVQQAAKNFPVTVWTSPDCGQVCNDARGLLSKRGVPFSERNPQKPDEAEVLKKLTGGESVVPVLQVGDLKTVKGYLEGEWEAALDAAGYPKNAPPLKPPPAGK